MGQFGLDLQQFASKTERKADLVVKKIVFEVGNSLVMKNPVGDATYWKRPAPPGYVGGRSRGNWQYALNAPLLVDRNRIDANGGAVLSEIYSNIPDKAAGKVHYITNTLDYIKALEEGHSRQAPHGFVNLTIIEFQPIVAAAARALA